MPQDLYKNIFGESAGRNDLLQITKDHPYFGLAHYYLLKTTDPSDIDHAKIAGRTALHFNNPFYLDYLIKGKVSEVAMDKKAVRSGSGIAETELNMAESEDKKEVPLFEPLYTTDYFASQGIKLSEEVNPGDKLGKQLKSFTDWLKTMKKLHDQPVSPVNEQIDVVVQHIAEKSNADANVITESLAEVYTSQGKKAKAREIYEKLSLLDPSKNAYFAGKIERLKEN